jgi:hypothetical protein
MNWIYNSLVDNWEHSSQKEELIEEAEETRSQNMSFRYGSNVLSMDFN